MVEATRFERVTFLVCLIYSQVGSSISLKPPLRVILYDN